MAKHNWAIIRKHYIETPAPLSYSQIAKKYNVDVSNLAKRAKKENWNIKREDYQKDAKNGNSKTKFAKTDNLIRFGELRYQKENYKSKAAGLLLKQLDYIAEKFDEYGEIQDQNMISQILHRNTVALCKLFETAISDEQLETMVKKVVNFGNTYANSKTG